MFKILIERFAQGKRTLPLPRTGIALPERFRGLPKLDPSRCGDGCSDCASACPVSAIETAPLGLDLGACVFCGLCEEACPEGAIQFTPNHRLSAGLREGLRLQGEEIPKVAELNQKMRRLFGRSLKLRQVSAGGCNGCEAELNALSNVVFDMARFGIQFVASPRHADGIVVTGPVTRSMERALRETWRAIPSPKIVIAVGACAIGGGPFAGSQECLGAIPDDMPASLYIPGCPPHPLTVLDGLLRLLGRLDDGNANAKAEVDQSVRPTLL